MANFRLSPHGYITSASQSLTDILDNNVCFRVQWAAATQALSLSAAGLIDQEDEGFK